MADLESCKKVQCRRRWWGGGGGGGEGVQHVIHLLPNSQPLFQQMYRLAPSELQEVQRQVTDLLAKQLIEPSTSPFDAPIFFVEKKTGGFRMVVDYRALDKFTVKNHYLKDALLCIALERCG